MRDEDLPDPRQGDPASSQPSAVSDSVSQDDEYDTALRGDDGHDPDSPRSLTDDLVALIDDGKTYVEAEVAYQKTRLAFAADQGKSVAIFSIAAFGLIHLALMALVFGVVIALAPLITAWGATAVVVLALLLVAIILLVSARNRARKLSAAYQEAKE